MSEPRWNEAGTREPARQTPREESGAWPTSSERAAGPRGEPGWRRPPANGASPRWGELPWGRGIVFVAVAASLGVLLTIVTGSDPGFLLGVLVAAGTVAASLAVNPRRAYLIIPAPALAYLAAAILAGLIHDRAADGSHTLLALNAARWIASGFFGMVAATGLAVLITVARWLRSSRRG
jgi:Domain of unknown function (DUF6542)